MSKNARSGIHSALRSLLGKISARFLADDPLDHDELAQVLKEAGKQHIIDAEALSIIEGALEVAELRVRDIMIPRARMVVVNRDDSLDKVLPVAIKSAHSRFPVVDDDKSEVIGIMLAKDLLQYCGSKRSRFNIRDLVRSVVFVPESKRLNVLLREFRLSRNHMAVVVDEYGGAAGLVTIEDVLEQIVGEIEDEYDIDEGDNILKLGESEYTIKAHTTIEYFNETFDSELPDVEFETMGGLVVNAIGHLPKRGESVEIDGFRFKVVRADSRRIRMLNMEWLNKAAAQDERSGEA